jgi:di/tricarboxylate transporter
MVDRVTTDQFSILAIMVATVGLFLWGRWRHDIVALAALLACVAMDLVPSTDAFAGFGHPAVITVACVLVLSQALQTTGAIDALTRRVLPRQAGPMLAIASISGLAALLSGFMNNVGALALLMPVGLQVAKKLDLPPGKVLMPLAFGSILGGMTTLIGTPPNLIVSGFRAQNGGGSFAMFDFSPVGVPVALAGLVFLVLVGWRLVPTRQREGADSFVTGTYVTEARVPEGSKAAGKSLRELEGDLEEADAQIVGLIRNERRIPAPSPFREVRTGDILVIEAEPEALAGAVESLGLKLEEDVREENSETKDEEGEAIEAKDALPSDSTTAASSTEEDEVPSALYSEEIELAELAVRPRGELVGRSMLQVRLRERYGINLLAVSRQGRRSAARLRSMPIADGDVLLVQGAPAAILEFANRYGCVPLAERSLRIPDRRKALLAASIMAASVAGAAFGLVPAAVAFAAGVLAAVLVGVIPVRQLYDAIDWSVIVLLAALIPVAGAMATTGAADELAKGLMGGFAGGNVAIALTLVLFLTMCLSDFMNNAATAAVMCPIAIGIASQLGVNADPFLMAVAVGASCAFLTPIGHQNNTLILGPGGFRFGDYWKLGLLIEIIVVIVAVPLLLWFWLP